MAIESYSYKHSSRNWITWTVVLIISLILVLIASTMVGRVWRLADLVLFFGVAIAFALSMHRLVFPRIYELAINHEQIRWRQSGAEWYLVQMSDVEWIRLTCPDEPSMQIGLKDGAEVLVPVMCLGDVLGVAAFLDASAIAMRVENRLGKHVPRW